MAPSVIIISGRAGSGKSTLSENLARHFGYRCVHSSDIFRQIKAQQELDPYKTRQGHGYWESDDAMKYYDERLGDLSLDKRVDDELLKTIQKANVVLDSWCMPWLSQTGLKIWLDVSEAERMKRLAGRDHMNLHEIKKRVAEKETKTIAIYKKLYGFEFGKDFSPFHFRIDTTKKTEQAVLTEALQKIAEFEKQSKSM